MKSLILFLSTVFLASSGMAASSEERDDAGQLSWVRAAAVGTDLEKYDILKSAQDHTIILPDLEKCKNIVRRVMHPISLKEAEKLAEISGKIILPKVLSEAIEQVVADFTKSAEAKDSRHFYAYPFVVYVGDRKNSLFVELYNVSEKIFPEGSSK